MSKMIFVTNKGMPISGRFEGKDYVFETDKEMEISEDAVDIVSLPSSAFRNVESMPASV